MTCYPVRAAAEAVWTILGRLRGIGGEMKDRIGNKLAQGDKVLVELPVSSIVGFIAELQEPGLVAVRRGNAANMTPGRVLVSCVIALPVEGEVNAVLQLVKVYDAAKEGTQGPSLVTEGTSEPSKAN